MASSSHKIVVAEPYSERSLAVLRQVGNVCVLDSHDEASLIRAVPDADALLVRTYSHVTRRVLERAKRLRVIGRAGVGLENIDLAAAQERNIAVVYTPAAATRSVAELTVGLMISLERSIRQGDQAVRKDRFMDTRRTMCGRELHALTVGIVGLGRIGTCVARTCGSGLGMRVLYNDIVDVGALDFEAEPVDKASLFRGADVVSLHVPLTPLTRHMVNADVLATFKPTATLINTARGRVVDLIALANSLERGRLAGAALDVFDPEPPPADHPIRLAPNVLLSPHVGARTEAGLARMNDVVYDVVAVLQGRVPQSLAAAE